MPVLPPRSQLLRYAAVALLPVVLSLWVADQTFYPTEDISELGWWANPLGQVLMSVAGIIALPAIPVFLFVGGILVAVMPERAGLLIGATVSTLFGALLWGWLTTKITNWVRSRRAV